MAAHGNRAPAFIYRTWRIFIFAKRDELEVAALAGDIGDSLIADFLRDNQATVESIFVKALRHAQERGELSRKQNPIALGRFFVTTIQGMRAMARLKSDRRALEEVALVALTVFDESVKRSGGQAA